MALGLSLMCGTGAVVDGWHWGCGGHVALGLWWTCGAGAGFSQCTSLSFQQCCKSVIHL